MGQHCRRYISEMEAEPMADESWQQRDHILVGAGYICNMITIYLQSTLNTNLSVVQNVTINYIGKIINWAKKYITIDIG